MSEFTRPWPIFRSSATSSKACWREPKKAAAPPQACPTANRSRELTAFGSNPGNLRMFVYVPERLPRNAPLVVALHGCSQSAAEYDHGSGWSSLADRLGFAVVYPEQQPANNPNNCFSWFLPGDTTRDQGEALSIRQMVEHAIAAFGVDRRRVFVTGLSAGGAMASVDAGDLSGGFCRRRHYRRTSLRLRAHSTTSIRGHVQRAIDCGARARRSRAAASNHRGPWPKISVWHGTADPIVKPANGEEIVRQWTDLHGLSAAPSYAEAIGGHTRRVWNDADGETLIELLPSAAWRTVCRWQRAAKAITARSGPSFSMREFLHASHRKLLAPERRFSGNAARGCGCGGPRPDLERCPRRRRSRRSAAQRKCNSEAPSFAADADTARRLDPNGVIATAFRAAGLPVPKLAITPSGAASHADPGAIIKAALKAAGLRRS